MDNKRKKGVGLAVTSELNHRQYHCVAKRSSLDPKPQWRNPRNNLIFTTRKAQMLLLGIPGSGSEDGTLHSKAR